MRTLSLAAGAGLGLLLAVAPLQAQRTTASLSGRVLDPTGAVLPGATVTVTNAATRVRAWSGVADHQGQYVAPSLPVGTYDLEASLAGFKTVSVKGVPLTVDQSARVDLPLSSGAMEETIVVTGEAFGQL